MKATPAVEAYAAMKASSMKAPTLKPSAVEAPADCVESTGAAHHSGSGMETASYGTWSTVNAVGVIAASNVVTAWAPTACVNAEVVIVGSVAVAVSVSITVPSISVPIEWSSIHPPG